jgi:UPF0716 protein FxsA
MSRIKPWGHIATSGRKPDNVNKSKLLAFALTAWIAIEVVAFVLVVQFLGMLAAIALGVGTTLLGLSDVKRLLAYLKTRVAQSRAKAKNGAPMVDGALQALGATLLILPGFASDLVGLALKAPSIRASLADKINQRDRKRGPQTIDLKPNEWKSLTRKGGKGVDAAS